MWGNIFQTRISATPLHPDAAPSAPKMDKGKKTT
jgi:hypothetical protein